MDFSHGSQGGGAAERLKASLEVFQGLEAVSKAFVLSIPLLLVCFLVYHWQMFLCVLVLLLPTVRLAVWWYRQGHAMVPLDYILQSFAKGFYVLLLLGTGLGFLAWFFASIIVFGVFEGIFGDGAYLAWFWLAEFLRWGTFCFVEELWKGLFVRWDRLRRQEEVGQLTRAHAVSGIALSLGYATSQSLLFVLIITAILENNGDAHAQATHEITGAEFGLMVFFSLFFGVVSMPLNIMGTYLTSIAINEAGEDSGECCCSGGGCDLDRCGYPPQGRAGCFAFLRILRWPVMLRTLLISQFIIWIVVWGLVVGSWLLVFSFIVITVACLYTGAYCIVKRAGGGGVAEAELYRSVYGFQLLDDEGNAPVPRHIGEAEEGGVRRWGPAPTADATATPTTTTTAVDASSVTIVKAVPSANLGASSAAPAPAAPATKESVLARFATMKQQQQQQQQPPPAPAQAATAASQQGGIVATNPLQVPSTAMGEGVVAGSTMEEMFDATIGATAANMRAQHNVAPAGSEGRHDDDGDDDDAEEEIDIFVGGSSAYPSI